MYVSALKKQWAVTEQVGMQTIKSLLTTYVLKILYPKIHDNQIVTRNDKLQHLIRVLGLSHHAPSKSPPAGRCCICIHVGWASKLHETITQPPMLNEHWEGCASYIENDCFDCADVRQCGQCCEQKPKELCDDPEWKRAGWKQRTGTTRRNKVGRWADQF